MAEEHRVMMEKPWLRHYASGTPPRLDYPPIPLTSLLEGTAGAYPGRPAVKLVLRTRGGGIFKSALTYAELMEEVNRFSAGLSTLGVQPGDRVGIMLPNLPQFLIAFYGALKAGAIVVNTNPTYTSRELEQQYRDAGITAVVLLSPYLNRLDAAPVRRTIRQVIIAEFSDYLPESQRQRADDALRAEDLIVDTPAASDTHRFRDLTASPTVHPVRYAVNPGDIALLQYTGGTTGVPKAAMLTHANLVANTLQFRSWLPELRQAQERIVGALPFFHIYGLTVAMNLAIHLAAELIVLPSPRPVEQILRVLEEERATVFPGVPTTYVAIINHPDVERYDLHHIKACISGAAPLPVDVQSRFEAITGGVLVEGYGLTEASPVTHCNPLPNRGLRKAGSIGVPLPDVEARIVHPERLSDVPFGQQGELWVRGPNVMSGYWNMPAETENALTSDGWLRTGDIARMDEEGFFYIVDRLKDIIIVSGLNVVPREVEDVLYEHPAVREAVVVGVPDPYRGESVKAFVVLKPGEAATVESLIAFCAERLARFKVPSAIEYRAELPKTTVGKPLRRMLAEEARQSGGPGSG
jgi:long-chain acyl-CoA synthetase